MNRHFQSLAAPAAILCLAAPLCAQLSPELAAFDAQVPGDLINDPTAIDWPSYGSRHETSTREAADIPGGGAARTFVVPVKGDAPYAVGANVQLMDGIRAGERITIGFYARTMQSERSDGQGIIGVRFQENTAPYAGFGDTTVLVGSKWNWYEVTAIADRNIRQSDAVAVLQLAGARQSLEIGQTIVVKGASAIALSQKPAEQQTATVDSAAIEMPDALRGTGRLINNPANRGWGHSGTAGRWENISVPEIWLGEATRFIATKKGDNRWDLGTSIPIDIALETGDKITVAVVARSIEAETQSGNGLIYARIQGTSAPYDGFGDKAFEVGKSWQMVRIPVTITNAFDAGGAAIALHFAAARQNVEIGPVYVFKTD